MSYAFLATKFDQKNCSVIQQGYNVVYKLFYNTVYNNHDVKGSPKSLHSPALNRNLKPEGHKEVHEDRLPEVNILHTCGILGSQVLYSKHHTRKITRTLNYKQQAKLKKTKTKIVLLSGGSSSENYN